LIDLGEFVAHDHDTCMSTEQPKDVIRDPRDCDKRLPPRRREAVPDVLRVILADHQRERPSAKDGEQRSRQAQWVRADREHGLRTADFVPENAHGVRNRLEDAQKMPERGIVWKCNDLHVRGDRVATSPRANASDEDERIEPRAKLEHELEERSVGRESCVVSPVRDVDVHEQPAATSRPY
jgi:hypothetical protein